MKKVVLFFTGVIFLLFSVGAKAQTKPAVDFFAGKWHVVSESSPGGGADMNVVLERKDGKLTGTIKIGEEDAVKFTRIEEKETLVKLYFTSTHGNDVNITMEKKDNDHVTGAIDTSVMGSFPANGERVKDKK